MNSLEREKLPLDVKSKIDEILAKHKIESNTLEPKTEYHNKPTEILKFDNKKKVTDRQIMLDPSRTIMSKTDSRGIIEYANDYFMEISGYEEYELMGKPHNIIRHPDMPKVIFKLLWDRLKKGENIHAFVKNLAKDGSYYWVLTDFETKYDEEGNIVSYYARRKAAPASAVIQIEKLYKTLRSIEQTQSMDVAERYFAGMLEEKRMSYDELILSILNIDEATMNSYFNKHSNNAKKKKGIMGRLFGK